MSGYDAFWSKVDRTGDCWLWIGTRRRDGYGKLWFDGRSVAAHRLSWTVRFGPIPDGLFVLHRCDNKICVRPEHLFVGTQVDNMRDMVAKGRHGHQVGPERWPSGERHHSSKLTADAVRDIRARQAAGSSMRSLAREFGVHLRAIQRVVRGETWTHV